MLSTPAPIWALKKSNIGAERYFDRVLLVLLATTLIWMLQKGELTSRICPVWGQYVVLVSVPGKASPSNKTNTSGEQKKYHWLTTAPTASSCKTATCSTWLPSHNNDKTSTTTFDPETSRAATTTTTTTTTITVQLHSAKLTSTVQWKSTTRQVGRNFNQVFNEFFFLLQFLWKSELPGSLEMRTWRKSKKSKKIEHNRKFSSPVTSLKLGLK